MTTDLLREALSDAAATVESVRPLRTPTRRQWGWVAPAAIVAAAAVVAFLLVPTAPPKEPADPPVRLPAVPRMTLAAYAGAKYVLNGAQTGGETVSVDDAVTGKSIARVPTPRGTSGFWDAAGAGDNRTFFLTTVDHKRAIVSFYRLRLREDGRPGRLTPLPQATLRGGLQGEGPQLLAATNGGTRLAYVTETGAKLTIANGGSLMTGDERIRERINIIDPVTGARRSVGLPRGTVADELVWAPDGRHLAYTEETPGYGLRILDTVTGAVKHVDLGGDDDEFSGADIGSDNEIVALVHRGGADRLVWYSLATMKVTRDVPLGRSDADAPVSGPTVTGDLVVVVIADTLYRVTGTEVQERQVGHGETIDMDTGGTW